VGLETTTRVSQRAKTIHALDRRAIVIATEFYILETLFGGFDTKEVNFEEFKPGELHENLGTISAFA
jgi:uncharacterized protein YebE (UPF0316 family)